jgi:hypothetical protein
MMHAHPPGSRSWSTGSPNQRPIDKNCRNTCFQRALRPGSLREGQRGGNAQRGLAPCRLPGSTRDRRRRSAAGMTRPGNPRFERGDARVGVHRAQNPEAPHTLKPPDLALDPVQPPRLPRLALGIGIAGRLRGCGHVAFLAAVQGPQSHLVASANAALPWAIGISSPSGVRGRQ